MKHKRRPRPKENKEEKAKVPERKIEPRLFPELQAAVNSRKINFSDAIYFQGIVQSGIISMQDYTKIIRSGIRPKSIGVFVRQVKRGDLEVRQLKEVLLDSVSRRAPQHEINRLLKMPKGRFYEQLNFLDAKYKMPLKFKQDLIRKRLEQRGLRKTLEAWEYMVKQKRLLYRAINMETTDVEIKDLPTIEAKVREMDKIEQEIEGLLFKI